MEPADVWVEWKRVTRHLFSSRIALAREVQLLDGLNLQDMGEAKISLPPPGRTYEISIANHRDAVMDCDLRNGLALLYSYGVVEAFARGKRGLAPDQGLPGGVEVWGSELLRGNGKSWCDVQDDKAGIVEVSIARNAFAHGTRTVTTKNVHRFTAHDMTAPWSEGDVIRFDDDELADQRRNRLKSLLRGGGCHS